MRRREATPRSLRGDEGEGGGASEHGPAHLRPRALPLRRDVAHVVDSCSAIRRSYAGRSERIVGSTSKLWAGGGEDVIHSSVLAPHGSSGAVRGFRSVRKMLRKKR